LLRQGIIQLLQGLQPRELTVDDLAPLERQYGVARETARQVRIAVWGDALEALIQHPDLSNELPRYMCELQAAFDLNDEQIAIVRDERVVPRFRAALLRVIEDHRVTDSERAALTTLADQLGIPLADGHQALEHTCRMLFDRAFDLLRHEGFTPESVMQMRTLEADLGIRPNSAQERMLSGLEAKWRLNAEERTALEAAVVRREAEAAQRKAERRAHLAADIQSATTAETVSVIGTRSFGDVAEPLHWEASCGRLEWRTDSPNRFDPKVLVAVDRGMLLVGATRLAFGGTRSEFRAPYARVAMIETSARTCTVVLDSGDRYSFGFEFEEEVVLFMFLVMRLAPWVRCEVQSAGIPSRA
jgi:hypothetical protein